MVKNKKIIELENKNKGLKEQLDVLRDRLYSYKAYVFKMKISQCKVGKILIIKYKRKVNIWILKF